MIQHTRIHYANDIMLPTESSVALSEEIYNEQKSSYQKGRCFDNSFQVISHNPRRFSSATVCYGYICSGIPKLNGVSVRHGWLVFDNQIVDVSVPAGGYSADDAKCYIYIPWREYTIDEYLDAMGEEVLPDVLLERDLVFRNEVEHIGYRYIG